MQIQLALDRLTREQCVRLVNETYDYIDIIEVGTGVIKEYGMAIIKEMKMLFPEKQIVADMKTCDAGKYETCQAITAGADFTTVMAFADNGTIRESVKMAHQLGGEVMIDLLGVTSNERVQEIAGLGATTFCLHKGKDMQLLGHFAGTGLLSVLDGLVDVKVAIAGGIDTETISDLRNTRITTVIIGSAITRSENPKVAAEQLRKYSK